MNRVKVVVCAMKIFFAFYSMFFLTFDRKNAVKHVSTFALHEIDKKIKT